jgi:hypothetical protein
VYSLTVVPYDFESYYMDVRPSMITGRKRTLCVRIAFISSNARKVECSRACQGCVGRRDANMQGVVDRFTFATLYPEANIHTSLHHIDLYSEK